MNLIFVYITNPNEKEAKAIAKHLLNKKLIACANIYSGVNSLYYWKGKLVDEKEVILVGKSVEKNYFKIITEVKKMHSYTTPCIIKIPVDANEDYKKWLLSEMN